MNDEQIDVIKPGIHIQVAFPQHIFLCFVAARLRAIPFSKAYFEDMRNEDADTVDSHGIAQAKRLRYFPRVVESENSQSMEDIHESNSAPYTLIAFFRMM